MSDTAPRTYIDHYVFPLSYKVKQNLMRTGGKKIKEKIFLEKLLRVTKKTNFPPISGKIKSTVMINTIFFCSVGTVFVRHNLNSTDVRF